MSVPMLIALSVLGGLGMLLLVWLFVEALVWVFRAFERWM